MKIVIIHSQCLDELATCKMLSLYFHVKYLQMDQVSPVSVNEADVILIEFFNASDVDLQNLEKRWQSVAPFPIVALVDNKTTTERAHANRFGISNI